MVINVGPIDNPVPYYAAADVFVLPTFYDPCSLSVSEAAASGLPSVTTRFNGAAELLTEGVDGFVISDPADDAELASGCGRYRSGGPPPHGRSGPKAGPEHTLDRNCDQTIDLPQIAGRKLRAA